jgi:peptidyl-dipeptidase A
MPIDDMIAKSDLFEKPGKNQHAYCSDIDRDKKDTRILCNVKNNSEWMKTLLHEFGHGVYFKYEADTLPWILKSPAHTFTTEAIAEMFGRFGGNAQWMVDMNIINEKEKAKIEDICHKYLRLEQLCFSRWSQVMFRFEMGLYENPDQDLNKLWWTLVEKYQLVKPPAGRNEPDWASKIHIATSPCYYHNYLLGEMLASQLYYHVKDKLIHRPENVDCSFYNSPIAGKFFMDKVFVPGAKFYWDDMIKNATGEKLTAKYYAKQFVK